ncbi:MAG: 2-C-methyl-D-erythritol 4-phosphate cytidylyltransferase [Anditalea sp.]
MRKFAIIVAGGSGTRMGASIPKQYLEIGGKPVLMHTLSSFYHNSIDINLILVIPGNDFEFWKKLCDQFDFSIAHKLVEGGSSRFQSVKNGLNSISEAEGLVAIHDGVRPFVNQQVIERGFQEAQRFGSAIAVVPLKDSIRRLSKDGRSCFQKREYFRLVQTPQTFQLSKIKQAFEVAEESHFTDDATVFEHQGWQVNLIAGNAENIKITTPEDIGYAEFLIQKSIH